MTSGRVHPIDCRCRLHRPLWQLALQVVLTAIFVPFVLVGFVLLCAYLALRVLP